MDLGDWQQEWENFLTSKASRCGLEGKPKEFFIRLFTDEKLVKSSIEDLVKNTSYSFKSCRGNLTKIFNTVGKDCFRKDKSDKPGELKQISLYNSLKAEFEGRRSKQTVQNDARSLIPQSTEEKLHRAIATLNYRDQEKEFGDALASEETAQSFLVRVDDLAMQKWLVWRLVNKFYEFEGISENEQEKPLCCVICASRKWSGLDELWDELAKKVGYSLTAADPGVFHSRHSVSKSGESKQWAPDREGDPKSRLSESRENETTLAADPIADQAIEAIACVCQTRSLILVVHQIQHMTDPVWEAFHQDFWQPLTQQLNQQPCGIARGKCVLFLTGDVAHSCPENFPVLPNFAAWETVKQDHMRPWLRNQGVRKLLTSGIPCEHDDLERRWIKKLGLKKPRDVIQGLGQEMGLEDGLDELKKYWDIGVV
jgi:hypothetical protein